MPILDLSFRQTRISLGGGALNVGPVAGSLTAVAAGALDGAFGLPAGTIPPGLKLGDATVRYLGLLPERLSCAPGADR